MRTTLPGRYDGQSTFIASGLNVALTEMENNARIDARWSIVLITDGIPTGTPQNPCQNANNPSLEPRIKNNAIYSKGPIDTIILGVGNGFSSPPVDCLVTNITEKVILIGSNSVIAI